MLHESTHRQTWVWLPVVQTDTWPEDQRLFMLDIKQLIIFIKSYLNVDLHFKEGIIEHLKTLEI